MRSLHTFPVISINVYCFSGGFHTVVRIDNLQSRKLNVIELSIATLTCFPVLSEHLE